MIIESFCARGILRGNLMTIFFFTPENKFLFISVTTIFFLPFLRR